MKIAYMGNGFVGWKILEWLESRGEDIACLIIHPRNKRKYGGKILNTISLPESRIFMGDSLREEEVIESIRDIEPDVGLSVYFGYILEGEFIDMFPKGVINVHPAYLPYNRGAYPNVWSIIEGTLAGVTLHYIDEGVDTGDILFRQEVDIEPTDTGKSLYKKLEMASIELFKKKWDKIKSGEFEAMTQDPGEGTYHEVKDIEEIDEIDLDEEYTARELIDLIRARTFPPYKGCYFETEDGRVYLQLSLEYEESNDNGREE